MNESKYWPAIAIGANDPCIDNGINAFESYYAVFTKGFEFKNHRLSATLGIYAPFQSSNDKELKKKYGVVFGGLAYQPSFYRDMRFIVEYDSKVFNAGVTARLWKGINVDFYMYKMQKPAAGLRYVYFIKN